jgi:hypothetical protein
LDFLFRCGYEALHRTQAAGFEEARAPDGHDRIRSMSDPRETTILTEADLRTVKELRSVLADAGIEAHVVRPPTAGNT